MNEEFDESHEIECIKGDHNENDCFKEKICRHDLYDFHGLCKSDFM